MSTGVWLNVEFDQYSLLDVALFLDWNNLIYVLN